LFVFYTESPSPNSLISISYKFLKTIQKFVHLSIIAFKLHRMKSIENLKKEGLYKELSNEKLNKIFGGELIPVNVGNIIVDDLNGLIR
jgi:hypothetical protein